MTSGDSSLTKRDLFPSTRAYDLSSESAEHLQNVSGNYDNLAPLFAELKQVASLRRKKFVLGIGLSGVAFLCLLGFMQWWIDSPRTPGFFHAWGRVILFVAAFAGFMYVINLSSKQRWLTRVAKEALSLEQLRPRPGETPQATVQTFFSAGLLGLRLSKSLEAQPNLNPNDSANNVPSPQTCLWPFLLSSAKSAFKDRGQFEKEWFLYFEFLYPDALGFVAIHPLREEEDKDVAYPVSKQIITDGDLSIVETVLAGHIVDYRVVGKVGNYWYFLDGKPHEEISGDFDRVRVMGAIARLKNSKKVPIPRLGEPNWAQVPILEWMSGEWLGASPAEEEVLLFKMSKDGQAILESSEFGFDIDSAQVPWRFLVKKPEGHEISYCPTAFRVLSDDAMIIRVTRGLSNPSRVDHPFVFIRRPRQPAELVE